jgi:Flp pilus assembly protein TadG
VLTGQRVTKALLMAVAGEPQLPGADAANRHASHGGDSMKYLRRTDAEGAGLSAQTGPRIARRMRGSSAVEFALVAPLFFLLCAGIIDFGRLFFVQMTLQDALRQAARYASTGQHQSGTDPGTGLPYTRSATIQQIITSEAAAAGVQAGNLSINVSSAIGGSGNPGGPLDTVTISVTTSLPLITGYIAQLFTSTKGLYVTTLSISFKNESFSPLCTTPPYTGC